MAHTYDILPKNIPQIISDIVEQVSINLATEIGSNVAFKHGTWAHIKKRIVEEATGQPIKDARFPLVCLVQVFEEKYKADSEYGDVSLTLLVCNTSDPAWYSEDRYTNNYIPTLYPIYAEFMAVLQESPYFQGYRQLYPEHTKADDLHLPENNENKLPECLDGLWIRDLKLRIYNNCRDVESWIDTEVEFGTPVSAPGFPTGLDSYPFTVTFSDLDGLKDGSTFTLDVRCISGNPLLFTADTNLSLSQVGNTTVVTIAVADNMTQTVSFVANIETPPTSVSCTAVVTSMGNLRNTWVNNDNVSDTVTI